MGRTQNSFQAAGAAPLRIWPEGCPGLVAGQRPQGLGSLAGNSVGPFPTEPRGHQLVRADANLATPSKPPEPRKPERSESKRSPGGEKGLRGAQLQGLQGARVLEETHHRGASKCFFLAVCPVPGGCPQPPVFPTQPPTDPTPYTPQAMNRFWTGIERAASESSSGLWMFAPQGLCGQFVHPTR